MVKIWAATPSAVLAGTLRLHVLFLFLRMSHACRKGTCERECHAIATKTHVDLHARRRRTSGEVEPTSKWRGGWNCIFDGLQRWILSLLSVGCFLYLDQVADLSFVQSSRINVWDFVKWQDTTLVSFRCGHLRPYKSRVLLQVGVVGSHLSLTGWIY